MERNLTLPVSAVASPGLEGTNKQVLWEWRGTYVCVLHMVEGL